MTGLYPKIEPYGHGMLDVGDGYQVYWETCGNLSGKPALVLHGGGQSPWTTESLEDYATLAIRSVERCFKCTCRGSMNNLGPSVR